MLHYLEIKFSCNYSRFKNFLKEKDQVHISDAEKYYKKSTHNCD